MTMDRIEVITSVKRRRRRWSAAEKARLVAVLKMRLVAVMNEPDAALIVWSCPPLPPRPEIPPPWAP
jgi:hypothetical protein